MVAVPGQQPVWKKKNAVVNVASFTIDYAIDGKKDAI